MLQLLRKTLHHVRHHGLRRTGARIGKWVAIRLHRVAHGKTLRALTPGPLFEIHRYRIHGDALTVEGHLIPVEEEFSRYQIEVDGVAVTTFFSQDKPLADRLWYLKGAEKGRFTFTASRGVTASAARDAHQVTLVDRLTGQPVYPHRTYHLPKSASLFEGLPDRSRMERVIGPGATDQVFVLDGFTNVRRFQQLALQYAGKDWATCRSILDWGCGCGRLTRHFLRERPAGARVVGADIDVDNIGWCQANLAGAEFVTLNLEPPSPLETASFDLIVGFSVMTHLNEPMQHAWLAELSRLAAPGAAVILTIHGPSAVAHTQLSPAWIEQWRKRGFDDSISDPTLTGHIPDPDYYRATFHTHEYIRREWSRYLKVEAIVPYTFGYQDAVILTRQS